LDGLRGEDSIAEICRREGIHQDMYYKWSRAFLEASKKRLTGDTMREASTDEIYTHPNLKAALDYVNRVPSFPKL